MNHRAPKTVSFSTLNGVPLTDGILPSTPKLPTKTEQSGPKQAHVQPVSEYNRNLVSINPQKARIDNSGIIEVPLPHGTSNATRELDDLMASLSDFKVISLHFCVEVFTKKIFPCTVESNEKQRGEQASKLGSTWQNQGSIDQLSALPIAASGYSGCSRFHDWQFGIGFESSRSLYSVQGNVWTLQQAYHGSSDHRHRCHLAPGTLPLHQMWLRIGRENVLPARRVGLLREWLSQTVLAPVCSLLPANSGCEYTMAAMYL